MVFAFPGGAGTVEANVQRWRSQFKDADGNPPRIESKVVKGKNVDVTRVETAGHYFPSHSAVPRSPTGQTIASSGRSFRRGRATS